MLTHRSDITEICDRLVAEFDGLLPPGQVIRTVLRAQRLVLHHLTRPEDGHELAVCEDIARRTLQVRAALPATSGPAPAARGVSTPRAG